MPALEAPKVDPPALIARHDAVAATGLGHAPEEASAERVATRESVLKAALLAHTRTPLSPEKFDTVLSDLTATNSRALLIGENHLSHDTRDLVCGNLKTLAARGFNTFAIEFPPETKEQLERFNKGTLDEAGFQALVRDQQKGFGEKSIQAYGELLKEARSLGMRIIPIDKGNSLLGDGPEQRLRERVLRGEAPAEEAARYFKQHVISRSKDMAEGIGRELALNPTSKVIALVGAAHLSMDGDKILHPTKYPPVTIPLLNNGTDSALRENGIPTSAIVIAQKIHLPKIYATYNEPSMVQEAVNAAQDTPSVIHPRRAGRPGGVDGFVVLAPEK